MVWVVEKKVVRHVLDAGFERVEIPVRVKFEFEMVGGLFVRESVSREILYNQKAIEKSYPGVRLDLVRLAVEETVDNEISEYLKQCGFVEPEA